MSWIDVVWPMSGAASLTLALIHFSIWLRRRGEWIHLVFCTTAISVAILAVIELIGIQADTPSLYVSAVRWAHLPYAAIIISMVVYVHLRFRESRGWLAGLVIVTRLGLLAANFLMPGGATFEHVDAINKVSFWGDMVAVPVGSPSKWLILGQSSQILLLIYLFDVLWRAWRSGDSVNRRRALITGGSMFVFMASNNGLAVLVVLGVVNLPIVINVLFVLVVMAMSFELGGEALRAAALSDDLARSEHSLRESEQRLKLAASAGGLGLWTWEIGSGGTWLTHNGNELMGLAAGDHIDWEGLLDCVHSDDVAALHAARNSVIERGACSAEFRVLPKAGSLRWLSLRGRREDVAEGSSDIVRGVLIDVTERREADEIRQGLELQAATQREELTHLSRIATLGEISGSLAHELNQPLTAILSNAQAGLRFIDRETPDLAEVRECLAQVVENDKRASEVIRRIRSMLRKDDIRHEQLDLNFIVAESLQLLSTDLVNRDVIAQFTPQAGLPAVNGDSVQLKQVLLNLVINACDAMRELRGNRRVSLATGRIGGDRLAITVTDCGYGIPQQDLDRIFSPFVTSKSDGIGLGLSICRTLIETHGGSMWAENTAAGGACFTVALPISGADDRS